MVIAAIAAVMAALLTKRPPDVAGLGSVSPRWIAAHRVDVP